MKKGKRNWYYLTQRKWVSSVLQPLSSWKETVKWRQLSVTLWHQGPKRQKQARKSMGLRKYLWG